MQIIKCYIKRNFKIRKSLLVTIILLNISLQLTAQDQTFNYVGPYTEKTNIKLISDSLHKPLLLVDNRIYSIGSNCIPSSMGGYANERNKNGAGNDRNKNGDANDRKLDGQNNERSNSGAIANRKITGKKNDRNKNGDRNDRALTGNTTKRNNTGEVGTEASCELNKKGKLILYTQRKMQTKKGKIFYNNQYYSSKYFQIKIIKK